jgi:hypothetical protein
MNFFKKLFNTVTLSCFSMLLMSLSCSKSEDAPVETPLRDFGVQNISDMKVIDIFINTYTYAIDSNNNITFGLRAGTFTNPFLKDLPTSGSVFPQLRSKEVILNNTTYTIKYLVFNEGNTLRKPTRVDDILVGYRGFYLENQSDFLGATPEFENNPIPSGLFSLNNVITGWKEIFPLFGTGTIDTTAPENGPTVYQNYGVGAIFIPSGLAYFNVGQSGQSGVTIPSYSPLVFTFKLFNLRRADQDGDKIESIFEDANNDGIFTNDDNDADGLPDFLDIDDDNDGVSTLNEIKKPDGTYYSFNDIPACNGNPSDANNKKRHLVKCQ